ncbi:MAG: pyridoxal phosphate-dependent aminotransferase family protein [Alphaproteobacteria bacterium]|nr:pyridoxal phosphate-dependent aminotransferase family protein [Alphaproteobacteria bacterium]
MLRNAVHDPRLLPIDPSTPLGGLARLRAMPMADVVVDAVEGRELHVGPHVLVDFATGAYLGLDRDLRDEDVAEARRWGLRNGWSRATGSTGLTRALEQELAAALGMDAVRLSTSAALLNASAFHGLRTTRPVAIYDQDVHISVAQGIRAAYPSRDRHVFPHADLRALERLLTRLPEGPKVIAVDGIYSMRGSRAPLVELVELARAHDALLFVDDVHGFGITGPNGLGSIESVPPELRGSCALLGSFAKAASNPVAFLAYPHAEWAGVESAPALVYSGPPSNLHVAVCRRHLAAFPRYASRRERVRRASLRLHATLADRHVHTASEPGSPVVAVGVQDASAEAVVDHLYAAGILCKAALYPVVRRGDEVLRFTVTAAHTDAHILRLEEALLPVTPLLRRTR